MVCGPHLSRTPPRAVSLRDTARQGHTPSKEQIRNYRARVRNGASGGPPPGHGSQKALPCLSKAWNWGGGTSAPEQKHATPQSSINAVTEDNVLQRRRLARASLLYKPLPAATARTLSTAPAAGPCNGTLRARVGVPLVLATLARTRLTLRRLRASCVGRLARAK